MIIGLDSGTPNMARVYDRAVTAGYARLMAPGSFMAISCAL